MNLIRVSNSLDPDQDQHIVGPDLDPNCLLRLSADNKRSLHQKTAPAHSERLEVIT